MTLFQKATCGILLACLLPASIATAQSATEKQAQQPIPSGGNFLGIGWALSLKRQAAAICAR